MELQEMGSGFSQMRILLVDDDEDEYVLTKGLLSDSSYRLSDAGQVRLQLDWTPAFHEALEAIEAGQYDAYLVDYRLGDRDGLELIRAAQERNRHAPLILMTGQGSYAVDVEAMKAGATDYLPKSEITAPLLERTIRYAIERKRAEKQLLDHTRRVELLAALSQAFTAAPLEYPGVLQTIVQQISVSLGDACVIRLVTQEEDGLRLNPVAYYHPDPLLRAGLSETLQKVSHRPADALAGVVFSSGEPLQLGPVTPEQIRKLITGDYAEFLLREGIHSVLILPLRSKGPDIIGTLGLLRFGQSHPYSMEDLYLMQDLADRAALAIENARLYAEVQKLAITDSLTELYNRRGFFELGRHEFERARRFGRPLSAMMMDIDHLKEVNDTYGHAIGDQVLGIIADRLRSSMREVDILGRYGGDEFVVLLPETDLETAFAVAERVRKLISEPICLSALQQMHKTGPDPFLVTTSLGVASLSPDTHDLPGLLARADKAAYTSKHNGRNRIEVG